MPVYRISHADYLKIRADEAYGFLADNAKCDQGDFMTLTLSWRSCGMLVERLTIDARLVDEVHHLIVADADELRNTRVGHQPGAYIKSFPNIHFVRDPSDATSADDGVSCIVSLDGKRFKPLNIEIDQ
jgi:hypothetical protein